MSGAINLLIADDDPIVRDGLAAIFNYQDGITVSATAANGVEALAAVERNLVDVALIDVDMPVLDGIAVAKILGRDYPYIAVVMLTAFEHEESLAQSLAANVKVSSLKTFLENSLPC
ncbi:response regulator transcription factor [Arcanobacterium hippocoleae]